MKALRWFKNQILRYVGLTKYLDSNSYIKFARSNGCKIGDGTTFYGEKKLDTSNLCLITIGANCKVTDGVRIVAHTGDLHVLNAKFGVEAPDVTFRGRIKIGNNVFIGEQSIILPDTTIGDNVIIGAGSVVSNDIPDGSVAVGNPCEVIMDIKEYNNKKVEKQTEMLRRYVRQHLIRGEKTKLSSEKVDEFIGNNTQASSVEEFAHLDES